MGGFGVELGSSIGATPRPLLYLECGYAWGGSNSDWMTSLFLWWLVTRFAFATNLVEGFLLLGL